VCWRHSPPRTLHRCVRCCCRRRLHLRRSRLERQLPHTRRCLGTATIIHLLPHTRRCLGTATIIHLLRVRGLLAPRVHRRTNHHRAGQQRAHELRWLSGHRLLERLRGEQGATQHHVVAGLVVTHGGEAREEVVQQRRELLPGGQVEPVAPEVSVGCTTSSSTCVVRQSWALLSLLELSRRRLSCIFSPCTGEHCVTLAVSPTVSRTVCPLLCSRWWSAS
jgi:hypothetical protein